MRITDNFSVYGSQISSNIFQDNNGQLVISNAVLARTGSYDYLESEVVPNGDPNKIVKVYRTPEEVFNPYSMASFENKPFCNDHPEDDVCGENFRELQGGFIRDIRRGTGNLQDCLIGTIVVTDPEMIDLIKSKQKRELSLGYNAMIEKDDSGRYIMTHIRGNHLALVDSGRAGIATIRDNKSVNKIGGFCGMKQPTGSNSIKDNFIRKLFDTDDVVEVEELVNDDDMLEVKEKVDKPVEVKEVSDDEAAAPETTNSVDFESLRADIAQIKEMLSSIIDKFNAKQDEEPQEVLDEDEQPQEEVKAETVEEVKPNDTEEETAPQLYDESDDEDVDEVVDVESDEVKDSKANPYAAFTNPIKDSKSTEDIHECIKNKFQEMYNKIGGTN